MAAQLKTRLPRTCVPHGARCSCGPLVLALLCLSTDRRWDCQQPSIAESAPEAFGVVVVVVVVVVVMLLLLLFLLLCCCCWCCCCCYVGDAVVVMLVLLLLSSRVCRNLVLACCLYGPMLKSNYKN